MTLWTMAHAKTLLPALAAMLVTAAVLQILIGNKPLKTRMIPFQLLSCVLVVLEIGKQFLSLLQGYDLYYLPFHFCSLFIFALPLMSFYNGKHQSTVREITAALCAAVFLLMLIYPSLIYSASNIEHFFDDYFSFHTVAFHNIVMFEFILIVALRLYTPVPRHETKAIVLFTIFFCGTAAVMSQLLKTNYANFYTCNVPMFENLRLRLQGILGAGLTQLLYVTVVSVLHLLFVLLSYWAFCFLRRRTLQVNPDAQSTPARH